MSFSFFTHDQIGANLLHLARVAMLDCSQHKKWDVSRAKAELDMAKDHLHNSIRFILSTSLTCLTLS